MPSSRVRSLLRDAARGLGQQMFFWGCDARHREGNLMTRAGMKRIARNERGGEGSSRYRMEWEGGRVEIHSFCAGWYGGRGREGEGVIFIRGQERIFSCAGGQPLTPGRYERGRMTGESVDEVIRLARPFLGWVLEYERRVRQLAGESYREECRELYGRKVHGRAWLPPAMAERWYRSFLQMPERTGRPRDMMAERVVPAEKNQTK